MKCTVCGRTKEVQPPCHSCQGFDFREPVRLERDELLNAVEELLLCIAAIRDKKGEVAQRSFKAAAERIRKLYGIAPNWD